MQPSLGFHRWRFGPCGFDSYAKCRCRTEICKRIRERIRCARVRVTHPFHPLAGRDFEFVEHRQNWGEDRVCLHDEDGQLFSLPAGWTDAAAADPFVVIAAGRCPFTADGLLALADLVPLENRIVLVTCRSSVVRRRACIR
jgi:uncharacterized protein DUF5372